MGEHLLHGKPVSDEQIQVWADEAEAGYDLADLPSPRRGRPPVGEGLATRSDAIRAAVRQYLDQP